MKIKTNRDVKTVTTDTHFDIDRYTDFNTYEITDTRHSNSILWLSKEELVDLYNGLTEILKD